nr:MAG TPA: hypothetical protein [Bacteriophage sp.]
MVIRNKTERGLITPLNVCLIMFHLQRQNSG